MDYMFPSRNNKNFLATNTSDKLINHDDVNLSQEEEPPVFLQFPSPFLEDMDSSTTTLPNLHNQNLSTDICSTTNGTTSTFSSLNKHLKLINATTKPFPSKLKCVRKKRIAGKKDRHSKIHTAQGLRDRRMRLSVHTARKFFDLNDMLGFDKASKTIEWLFNKSKKAIEEVTESLQSDDAATQTVCGEHIETESPPFSAVCETESMMRIAAAEDKDKNLEIQGDDQINDKSTRKPMEYYPLVSDSSERTRERMMRKHLEKQEKLFEADPNGDFGQSQLGYMENPDNHTIEESSCYPLEYSNTYHFLKHLHLDSTVRNPDTYLGNMATTIPSTNCSIIDYNKTIAEPSAGWLNSRNTFLGFLGGWDSGNSNMESNNGIVRNVAPFAGNIIGENLSPGINSTSNLVNFHPQNQGRQ